MKRKLSLYIKDIIDAIIKIHEFTEGMNFKEFVQDDKTSSAVIRKLEIMGEAVKQLPEDVTKRFNEIPWSSIAKTRDKIVRFSVFEVFCFTILYTCGFTQFLYFYLFL